MNLMPSITSVKTNLPPNSYNNTEILNGANIWLQSNIEARANFERFLSASHTENRHFILPLKDLLQLSGQQERGQIFEEAAPSLAEKPIREVLAANNLSPAEIDVFIFTSCTCPLIPSIDGLLVDRLGLRKTVMRIPIYQQGCAGGVIGISLANQLALNGSNVLLTSVELCSLVFQREDLSKGQLVGAAIFGDGTASALIMPSPRGLIILDTQSFLVPHTRHLMGYDILNDGPHLRLDKNLPRNLVAVVPGLVQAFLAKNLLAKSDISFWLFHPGGIKILDFLDQIFELEANQSQWSRDVLRNIGNLSSSSILFVLSQFLESQFAKEKSSNSGKYCLILGVGPGLTIELILVRINT